MEIYDIFGRKIDNKDTPLSFRGGAGGGVTMDVSSLPPGLYLLVVKEGQAIISSAKILVAR